MKPRVRIAPSPTGFLHVGTARAALYNWLFAKNQGGSFILRIEDTDLKRSSMEMSESIIESLKWLGLNWDEGPFFQSQRTSLYKKYALLSHKKGLSYSCWCSPEEIETRKNIVIAQKKAWKYDRQCLNLPLTKKQELSTQPYALRFFIPEGKVTFVDLLHNTLERDSSDIEDFVIWKTDGTPSYNFTCVIDDHEMGITHIIRGEDHISNTFKQILLYKAFHWEPPVFIHLPMILGPDRSKLSKRHGAVSVLEYQKQGVLPSALMNYLALLGWSPGGDKEVMSEQELIDLFSLDKLGKTPSIFDFAKLAWLNGEHINRLSDAELLNEVLHFAVEADSIRDAVSLQNENKEYLLKIVNLLKPRMRLLSDFVTQGVFFFKDPEEYDKKGVEKYFKTGLQYIPALLTKLVAIDSFDLQGIENVIRITAEELGIKAALLIHTLRLSLTGQTVGPSLFHIMEVLGKTRVIRRLEKVLSRDWD